MRKAWFVVFILIIVVFSTAMLSSTTTTSGHVRLLAVTEGVPSSFSGSIADLFLEADQGKGRVFIDTRPASKLDTQMSTRLANRIGCKYVGADCSSYDFFYRVTSDSTIVGGPSASAAVALLTAAVVQHIPLRDDVAITGTVSSGYLIGSVGGLPQKIEAAAQANISKVLIPSGERYAVENESLLLLLPNATKIDLIAYGKKKGVEVIEVSTLDDAFYEFTGVRLRIPYPEKGVDESYRATMKFLAEKLCTRSRSFYQALQGHFIQYPLEDNETILLYEAAINLTNQGTEATTGGSYYAGASYCFGSNVQYRQVYYASKQIAIGDVEKLYRDIRHDINEINTLINQQQIETITDLQAYMIVKERLIDTNQILDDLKEETGIIDGEPTDDDLQSMMSQLAYAQERLNSAIAWSTFFNKPGEKFSLRQSDLQASCQDKLSETEEYFQYLTVLIPGVYQDTQQHLEQARGYHQEGFYELCLFKASLAKAQMNMVLSSIGVQEDQFPALVDRKLEAVEYVIAEQQSKNIFPILGYSYYEYASSLKEDDVFSALLYAEYALEVSNLDLYFTPQQSAFSLNINKLVILFIGGLLIGIVVTLSLVSQPIQDKDKKDGYNLILGGMNAIKKKRR